MDEDTCHCGAKMDGSDHCGCCYCEQYERTCDWKCPEPAGCHLDHN
jgi:hypothetical protein